MEKISVINFSKNKTFLQSVRIGEFEIISIPLQTFTTENYTAALESVGTDYVVLADADRVSQRILAEVLTAYKAVRHNGNVGYLSTEKWFRNFVNLRFEATGQAICASPFFIGKKESFVKIAPAELQADPMAAAGYMLQRNHSSFVALNIGTKTSAVENKSNGLAMEYYFRYPMRELASGRFFKNLFSTGGAKRQPVWRFLMLVFAVLCFVWMPMLSADYGISGDEYVDNTHAGYVLDYFANGDKKAIDQPKTNLHYYGNSIQVVTAAVCRWFDVEDYYEMRHVVSALVGALGILFVGLLALRLGGGLCGLTAMVLMFLTPRYFGHSMNNLKDVPFAVGYLMSVYYTIRLFDHFPRFQLRHIIGVAIGIGFALGTRSGALVLYPMLLMYAGFFYVKYYGWGEFYKFGKNATVFNRIVGVLLVVLAVSYVLAIALWPYALQDPFHNVLVSLERFTHFSIGLRTIFDGEQMMSTMLPWRYAPKFLMIAMPIVVLIGFGLYMLVLAVRRKDFSLNLFFIYFAAVMPVVWVIYKNSNLYGGIRHMLFVMPMMVVAGALFWTWMMQSAKRYIKYAVVVAFAGLTALPAWHFIKNHPNEYVYFNEFAGGLEATYGDYETDYYFNSMKESAEWLKKNMVYPEGRKVVIATQHVQNMQYYFRRDTNVKVIYTRYYEKYSKDWDYAIFANVYINCQQLKRGLFPPEKCLFAPKVDGFPMSVVLERTTHDDYAAFKLSMSPKTAREAITAFRALEAKQHGELSEEAWARLCRLYFTVDSLDQCIACAQKATALHPTINEALSIGAMCYQRMQKPDEALKMVNRILAENESAPEAHFIRAGIYFDLLRYKEAIDDLNITLSYRPDHVLALNLAGKIMYEVGQYQQAAKIYEQALTKQGDISIMTNMALCLFKLDNVLQGEDLLDKVLAYKPDFVPALKAFVRLRLLQNRLPEAQKYLAEVARYQQDAEYYLLDGMCLYAAMKPDEAVVAVERSLQMQQTAEAMRFKEQLKNN